MIYTQTAQEWDATCSHALFAPLNCPTSPPTSESVMRSLCHYSDNAVNDVPAPVTTPVWCTPWEHIQQTAGIFSLLSLRWGGGGVKINKWQSNSGYANLISHASCVLPCLLGSSQLRLQGKWQRIGLIWVISSVMIMRLCTLFVAGTKGHINKRRFELMCKRSGTQSTYIKACVLLQGPAVLFWFLPPIVCLVRLSLSHSTRTVMCRTSTIL